MKARHFYLVCYVLGLVFPSSQFVPWLLEHGLNFTVFFRELFANRISAFFAIGCDRLCNRADLVYSKAKANVCGSGFLVADGWNIGRRCIVWIPLFLFPKQVTLDRTTARA